VLSVVKHVSQAEAGDELQLERVIVDVEEKNLANTNHSHYHL